MENVFKHALDKLAVASEAINNATPDRKVRSYDLSAEKIRSTMFDAHQAVASAKLAIEEALGAVPVERQKELSREAEDRPFTDVRERHESYGLVEVTKTTGVRRLVGTMTGAQPSYVSFKVYRAHRNIDQNTHSEHYFHEGQPLVEFSMSVYQWAEMMSSMQGQATCCTLDRVMGVQMEKVPEEATTPLEEIVNTTREKLFNRDLDQVEKDFWADVEALSESVDEFKLSQKAKSALQGQISNLKKHSSAAKSAATWATQRFTEETEKAISTAKVEISAAVDTLAHRRGLSAFKEDMAALSEVSVARPVLTEGKTSDED